MRFSRSCLLEFFLLMGSDMLGGLGSSWSAVLVLVLETQMFSRAAPLFSLSLSFPTLHVVLIENPPNPTHTPSSHPNRGHVTLPGGGVRWYHNSVSVIIQYYLFCSIFALKLKKSHGIFSFVALWSWFFFQISMLVLWRIVHDKKQKWVTNLLS